MSYLQINNLAVNQGTDLQFIPLNFTLFSKLEPTEQKLHSELKHKQGVLTPNDHVYFKAGSVEFTPTMYVKSLNNEIFWGFASFRIVRSQNLLHDPHVNRSMLNWAIGYHPRALSTVYHVNIFD